MNVNEVIETQQKVNDFLLYHKDVIDEVKSDRYVSAVLSVYIGSLESSVHFNEDVFDAVVKNPKVITDHGCDPLGVRISPTSSQAMECSFLWNGLRIYCIKNLDLDACNGVNHDG